MKLKEYIKKQKNKKETIQFLAKSVNKSPSAVYSWYYGQRFPSRKSWKLIVLATGGQVTLEDLASS